MLTEAEIKQTATNLRKLASDPALKRMFSSALRKAFNDDANAIMNGLRNHSERLRSDMAKEWERQDSDQKLYENEKVRLAGK